VLIRPEVGAFATLDFYKVDQILKAGEACREQLKRAIDQAVATASAEI
jgi:predicted acylesterase/phospholipase RssA